MEGTGPQAPTIAERIDEATPLRDTPEKRSTRRELVCSIIASIRITYAFCCTPVEETAGGI
jgi:hypothetical protein